MIIYYSLQADTQDQSQVANRNIIFSLLKRCTSGQIIGLDSTEASLYCLRSLLKLALASEVHLGCFILTEMLQVCTLVIIIHISMTDQEHKISFSRVSGKSQKLMRINLSMCYAYMPKHVPLFYQKLLSVLQVI